MCFRARFRSIQALFSVNVIVITSGNKSKDGESLLGFVGFLGSISY